MENLTTQLGVAVVIVILLLREILPFVLKAISGKKESENGLTANALRNLTSAINDKDQPCAQHLELKEQIKERVHKNDCKNDKKILKLEVEKTMDEKIEKFAGTINEQISSVAAAQEQVATEVTQIGVNYTEMAKHLKKIAEKV